VQFTNVKGILCYHILYKIDVLIPKTKYYDEKLPAVVGRIFRYSISLCCRPTSWV